MLASKWGKSTKKLLKELHKELSISDRNWHQDKGSPEKRAAELLINALTQLINNGNTSDVEALTSQAIKWLKLEIKDPGCPHHSSQARRKPS
tara:strand:- start:65 stop:340 length:276 start_codon:yes stop_codon:yes gene_type:complete